MTQRTSIEVMMEHDILLATQYTAIDNATRNIQNKYTPQLRALMAEFVAARTAEREAATAGGTPPDEYSKPIDKSGCAK